MADYIRYETREGIATITIDRPEKRNAMTYAMLGDFIAAVQEAAEDRRLAPSSRVPRSRSG